MEARRAAEPHHGEFARVHAALHRHQPDALRDGGADDLVHAEGSLDVGKVERCAHMLCQGLLSRRRVETGSPAQEIGRIQVAQHQAGIGNGGIGSTLAVAGRSGFCAGAVRANVENSSLIHPGDAAPAGAQRVNVNHRRSDLPAGLELLVGDVRRPVLDK